ncbi:MAG TPA: hypothetical protein ENK70_08030, partial [Methylophaga sp.]|nr:hypothetical protein [Methylophaga sp.]
MAGNSKIIGPEIVQSRIKMVTDKNIWQYVKMVNRQLTNNNIREDGSIDVTANFIVDPDLVLRLESMYSEAGWDRFEVTHTEPS